MVLRAEINWCSRVVHRWVAWIRSWDLATRTSDHLTKAVNLVVCEEPDLVERIKALLVDDDLRRGYSEADAIEHRTHGVNSRHRSFSGRSGFRAKFEFWGFYGVPSHCLNTDSNGSQSYMST